MSHSQKKQRGPLHVMKSKYLPLVMWAACLVGTIAAGESSFAGGIGYTPPSSIPGAMGPPAYISGTYYTTQASSITTNSLNTNTLYAQPFYSSAPQVWTKISVDVTTGVAAQFCELGVYLPGANGLPGALLVDAGQVSAAANGQIEITGQSIPLGIGVYWMAVACTSASVSLEGTASNVNSWTLGYASGATPLQNLHVAWTYSTGTLPNPFGTPTTGTAGVPLVYLRF